MNAIGSPLKITLVVAVAENGIIGRAGALPWRMPSDLKTFRRLTLGKPVVMGRKTFQSLGKPLDGRDNIVVTRDSTFAAPGAHVVADLGAALDLGRALAAERGVAEVAVIGGGEIYRAALALADQVYLTRVAARPEGDATFPDLDPATWQETSREPIPRGPRDDHDAELVVYDRLRNAREPGRTA